MAEILEKLCNSWTADSLRLFHTPGALARSSLYYLQEVGYFKAAASYYTERANLPSYLVIRTLSGRGILERGGQRWSLEPGTCMFLDCREHHRYFTAPGGMWEFLWVHFDGSSTRDYYREFLRGGQPVIPLAGDRVDRLLWDIIHLKQEQTAALDLQMSQKLVTLLTELLLSGSGGQLARSWPSYLRAVLQEMSLRYADNLTLEELAREHNISKSHLSREFKRVVGVTFSDYLTRIRMDRAKELLRSTDLPIGEVADRSGYDDVSYFIRVFRQREDGVTPLVYRRRWT